MPRQTTRKTYGTVNPEARAGTTGFEFVRGLADGTLPLNTIAETLGYDVVEAANGRSSSPSCRLTGISIHRARCWC